MRKEEGKEIYLSASEVDALDKAQDALRSKKSFATFMKHANLQTLHKFLHHALEIYYRDVEVNDPIIGKWDIHPFLRHSYKITIEEIPTEEPLTIADNVAMDNPLNK